MRSEIITCDVCGAKHDRSNPNGEIVRAYYLRLPSFYLAGNAKEGKCLELDLCDECAAHVFEMKQTVENVLKKTLYDMKAVER